MTRIVLVVAWLWVAVAAGWLSLSSSAQSSHRRSSQATTPPQATAPQPAMPGPIPASPATPTRSQRQGQQARQGRTRARRRRPGVQAATVRADARRRRRQWAHPEVSAMKPAEVSQTCIACHNREPHAGWEANSNPRSPAAALGCESCHGPGPGARRRRRQGQHPEVQRDEAGGGQPDLPHLPQPRHARRLGRQHARRAESRCATCHSVHSPEVGRRASW